MPRSLSDLGAMSPMKQMLQSAQSGAYSDLDKYLEREQLSGSLEAHMEKALTRASLLRRLSSDPDFKEVPLQDLQEYFDSIYRLSPDLMSDYQTLKSSIKPVVAAGGMMPMTFEDVPKLQESFTKRREAKPIVDILSPEIMKGKAERQQATFGQAQEKLKARIEESKAKREASIGAKTEGRKEKKELIKTRGEEKVKRKDTKVKEKEGLESLSTKFNNFKAQLQTGVQMMGDEVNTMQTSISAGGVSNKDYNRLASHFEKYKEQSAKNKEAVEAIKKTPAARKKKKLIKQLIDASQIYDQALKKYEEEFKKL
jgi:hypothetical protein